ncbi:MAG: hypothetical protein GC159_04630 [Phycisphaera sp.]|nr:hypothetical protein [Phycisphaera sp.]
MDQRTMRLLAACVLMMGVAGCESVDRQWKIVEPDPTTFTKDYKGDGSATPAVADAAPTQAVDVAEQGSLTGLSRQNWEPITVTPVRGTVAHRPRYFTDKYICGRELKYTKDRPSPLTSDPSRFDEEMTRATSGSRMNVRDSAEWKDAGLGFLKFGHDIIVLPYTVLKDTPDKVQYSPPSE